MENKFCYLKGLVECDSGRIQDCNNKRVAVCQLEQGREAEIEGRKKRRIRIPKIKNIKMTRRIRKRKGTSRGTGRRFAF